MDEQGHVAFFNAQAEKLFGYPREEILGKPVETLVPERLRDRHALSWRVNEDPRARPMGGAVDLFGLRRNGTEFPLEVSLAPMRVREGAFAYVTFRDVTERRRAEGEFDRLRRQQELLLSSVMEGVISLDERGMITYANSSAAKLLGYRVEEMMGRSEHEFFHARRADDSPYPEEMCPIHRSVADGTIHHASGEVFWRKDRTSFAVEYTSAPIRQGGRHAGASLIFADVTDRQRSDEILRTSNKRMQSVYEGMPEPFISVDREWRIAYANPLAERMRADPHAPTRGRTLWEAFPELVSKQWETEARRAMSERTRTRAEDDLTHLDRWLEATMYPADDGIAIYFRDVTDRKRGEAAMREASIARPLARRIVQDLVEQGSVAHQILTQVGRKLANETKAKGLDDHLASYRDMGLGKVEVEKGEGGRYSFSGSDLLERRPGSRVATCSFTLGYLSEAVSHLHSGEPTLGTEIECQSRGAARCRFIVQVKKPEEGLARRVKELI